MSNVPRSSKKPVYCVNLVGCPMGTNAKGHEQGHMLPHITSVASGCGFECFADHVEQLLQVNGPAPQCALSSMCFEYVDESIRLSTSDGSVSFTFNIHPSPKAAVFTCKHQCSDQACSFLLVHRGSNSPRLAASDTLPGSSTRPWLLSTTSPLRGEYTSLAA